MAKIWEFYENMNEIVYVSDMDTYDIIYMNRKLREMYHVVSMREVANKKCYEFFQKSSTPCSMCNNFKLKPGFFDEWTYFNPIYKKPYFIKDTMIEEDGKRYRIEVAVDMLSNELQKQIICNYAEHEAMISEGLKQALSTTDPDQSIMILLEYIGKTLDSERTYVFQLEDNRWSNTYEWCATGVTPQIDDLQQIPFEVTKLWMERFQRNENVIISDVCNIRNVDPLIYAILQPQSIRSLLASPLIYNNQVIGFYGIDNPPVDRLKNISTLFLIVGSFMVSLIRRKALFVELERISLFDHLTGFGNRHAMQKFADSMPSTGSIGVIYCDVIGLKKVNDSQGHNAGDALLLRACKCIRTLFSNEQLFRIGGDEFLIVTLGTSKEKLQEKVYRLRQLMQQHEAPMAIGVLWHETIPDDFDALLAESDALMYEDKRIYYANVARKL